MKCLTIFLMFFVALAMTAEHRHSKRVKRQFQFPNFGFQNFPQPNFPQQNFPQFNFPGQSSGNLFNQPSNNLNNRFGDDPIKDQQNFFSNNGFGSNPSSFFGSQPNFGSPQGFPSQQNFNPFGSQQFPQFNSPLGGIPNRFDDFGGGNGVFSSISQIVKPDGKVETQKQSGKF